MARMQRYVIIGTMNKVIAVFAMVVIVGGGLYLLTKSTPTTNRPEVTSPDTSAMRVEENMVVVTEQLPGNTVTASQVHLASPGFLVIHEDTNGAPGAILGSSALLSASDSSQIKITLSRSVKDQEKLHAMLHNDTNGNGTFDASDQPVQSRLGGPIEGSFDVSSTASDAAPVSI
jgi:hypothetical protein